jgi:methyl-accepting chemotaxis protein
METAAAIGQRFEAALDSGEITLGDLFDERYKPIPGSNPQQFMNHFVNFTDAVLPEFQEPILDLSPLVTFCAAVDRNAFLPTHNLKFSLPQGNDPVKNAATSRNRRIFNDRTGLRAAKNKSTFLLQTYRREMSAGVYVLMKDVSAPIWVQGKHWGGVRIGYRFAD